MKSFLLSKKWIMWRTREICSSSLFWNDEYAKSKKVYLEIRIWLIHALSYTSHITLFSKNHQSSYFSNSLFREELEREKAVLEQRIIQYQVRRSIHFVLCLCCKKPARSCCNFIFTFIFIFLQHKKLIKLGLITSGVCFTNIFAKLCTGKA